MDGTEPPKSSLRSGRPYLAVALVLLALALAGVGTWLVLERTRPAPPPVVEAPPAVDAGAPEGESVDPAQGDVLVADLVPPAWLEGGDVVRRAATAVWAVSQGQSPRLVLPFLDPGGVFLVDEVRPKVKPKSKRDRSKRERPPSKFFISEKNDARYDAVTQAFTAIDAEKVGRAYGRLRPYLESAFREIAPPGKTFDAAFIAAVDRLAAVPISEGPREVIPLEVGVAYAWADPKLEALSPAEKHLLRMGPKNARAVVKQLQAFKAAMAEAGAGG